MSPRRSPAPTAEPPRPGERPLTRLKGAGLIALMAAGSVLMWLGVPLAWLFVASRLSSAGQPSFGLYVLVLVAIALSIAAMGKVLGRLDRAYGRLAGAEQPVAGRAAWLRSMRDDRTRRRGTVLDVVMAWSVGLALLAFAVWFFVFAGSSLPG